MRNCRLAAIPPPFDFEDMQLVVDIRTVLKHIVESQVQQVVNDGQTSLSRQCSWSARLPLRSWLLSFGRNRHLGRFRLRGIRLVQKAGEWLLSHNWPRLIEPPALLPSPLVLWLRLLLQASR